MPGDAGGGPGSKRRWERAFELFGIAVVLLFGGVLGSVLLFGGGESGHRGAGGGNESSGGGQGPPAFVRSFGFAGLVLTSGYLGGLAVWGGLRRKWTFVVRHVASAAAMLLLVVLYLNAFGGLEYDIHAWNRSFANASVVLYAVTLALSPLARLWRPANRALAWRRETGIWATIAAAMHVGIFWEGALAWDWRPFFYPGGHGDTAATLMGDRSRGLLPTAFNLANVVGLVALAYSLVLALASNEASQRWLRSGWSWIMRRSTTMWLLVLLHAWLFAYYITFGNVVGIGTLWAGFWMVLLLQTAAFGKTVWLRRLGSSPANKRSAART